MLLSLYVTQMSNVSKNMTNSYKEAGFSWTRKRLRERQRKGEDIIPLHLFGLGATQEKRDDKLPDVFLLYSPKIDFLHFLSINWRKRFDTTQLAGM